MKNMIILILLIILLFQEHILKRLLILYVKDLRLTKKSFVIEAGSNDGTFLKEIFNVSKAKVLGVDPAKNITNLAKKKT